MKRLSATKYGASVAALGLFVAGCNVDPGAVPNKTTASFHVRARTPLGDALEGISVQVGKAVVITDGHGLASFDHVVSDKSLSVQAACPPGTTGQALQREIPFSVLGQADRWEFELVCEADHIQMTVAIMTDGCGEMQVRIDDVPVGKTAGGLFHFSEPRTRAGAVTIAVAPAQGLCELPASSQTFSVSADSPGIWTRFSGVRPRKIYVRPRREATKSLQSRPYRL